MVRLGLWGGYINYEQVRIREFMGSAWHMGTNVYLLRAVGCTHTYTATCISCTNKRKSICL